MNSARPVAVPERRAALYRVLRAAAARQTDILLLISVVSAAVLVLGRLNQGWFSHDDGSLAHSAERILAGELPHRDFAELYTGLLSFLNAAVFAVFGHNIINLRIPLLVLFLAFAGVYFALARRLVRSVWAYAATLFAIVWSVPVYPAPLPSWFGLFLATFALYAMVRFVESGNRRWLLVAGACAGLSIAVKIVGVYLALALVLWLLVRPIVSEPEAGSGSERFSAHSRTVVGAALLAFGFVIVVMSGGMTTNEFVALFLPIATLCGALVYLGWRGAWNLSGTRPPAIYAEVGIFLAGCAVPVVLLTMPYILSGGLSDLLEGTLLAPRSRFEFATLDMPSPTKLAYALPPALILLARGRMTGAWRNGADAIVGASVVYLTLTASSDLSYTAMWDTTRALAPFVLLLGAVTVIRPDRTLDTNRGIVTLIVLVAGFWTLIQFPFSAPVYFCYVAPLILLSAIAGMRALGLTGGLLPALILLCLVLFGVRQLDRQAVSSLGHRFQPDPQVAILDGKRASIRVLPEDKRELDAVRALVAGHTAIGDAIFAGPDAPEVYFLTQSRNVTRSIMDFLDSSGTTRGDKLIATLRDAGIRVVVLNHDPSQSPRLGASTVEKIRERYQYGQRVGKFEVRWLTQRTPSP